MMPNVFRMHAALWWPRVFLKCLKHCNLWLQGILLLVVKPSDLTHTCPQACLCLFSLAFLQRRYCSQALHLLSSSYWNNAQNV